MLNSDIARINAPNLDLFTADYVARAAFTSTRTRTIKIAGRLAKTTPVFEAYWYFAAERQKIFMRRIRGTNQNVFTDDPILSTYKFTNAYRAADRVSQYLIKNVIYPVDAPVDAKNLFFRVLLFKIFNKIETWSALEDEFGVIRVEDFDFKRAVALLSRRKAQGLRNYSAAYIMPSCGKLFDETEKHAGHLKLLEKLLKDGYHERLAACSTLAASFSLLSEVPSFGPFLAFQYAIDLNYSPITNFSEMEHIVAGPGALDGISKCFQNADDIAPADIIRYMSENQSEYLNSVDTVFDDLWGRPLQLIDCQNLFCEISKYSRVAFPDVAGLAGRTRIKQKFQPSGHVDRPFFPPKWEINALIG